MGKISLVIADTDADYVKRLEKYLLVNCSQRFDILSFTDPSYLPGFLEKVGKRANVLLIGSGFEESLFPLNSYDVAVRLSEDTGSTETAGKYQHAEKLISDICRIYAQNSRSGLASAPRRNTTTACVFSPAGGVGKSAIAAGCSVLCAARGMKTFYLNLENQPSTSLYFKGSSCQSFSDIIYYLKDKDGNLPLKLQGAACTDTETGVHFFLPPDNSLEMDELSPDELAGLVSAFRTAGCYDMIFIDTQGGLTLKNLSVLKASDIVIQVCGPDLTSACKADGLKAEQGILESRHSFDLAGKSIFILNKYAGDDRTGTSSQYHAVIPEIDFSGCNANSGKASIFTTEFMSALDRVHSAIFPASGDVSN